MGVPSGTSSPRFQTPRRTWVGSRDIGGGLSLSTDGISWNVSRSTILGIKGVDISPGLLYRLEYPGNTSNQVYCVFYWVPLDRDKIKNKTHQRTEESVVLVQDRLNPLHTLPSRGFQTLVSWSRVGPKRRLTDTLKPGDVSRLLWWTCTHVTLLRGHSPSRPYDPEQGRPDKSQGWGRSEPCSCPPVSLGVHRPRVVGRRSRGPTGRRSGRVGTGRAVSPTPGPRLP